MLTGSDTALPVIVLSLLSIGVGGVFTFKKNDDRTAAPQSQHSGLMVIAATSTVLIGQLPQAAMVMFLLTLAEMV